MELLILGCLILLNGLFAMSEVAVLTSRRARLAALARGGDRFAGIALQLVESPTRFLSTIQIGITSIGILNGIIGEAVLAAPVAVFLQSLGVEAKASAVLATGAVVVGVTYVTIVVGELVPKRLGQHNSESIAKLIAWPMRLLARTAAPFVSLLSLSTDAILRALLALLRIRPLEADARPLSPEELRTLVLESGQFMPKKHFSILMNLFDLGDITVQDIMLPRAQIESITLEEPLESILRELATSTHRRLPVYRERDGEVIGILHLRKVLDPLRAGTLTKEAIATLLVEPYFVPSTTPVFSQLQYFQEKRENIALVVDEYGELMGLVTLEDILEEIVGKFTAVLPSATAALAWDANGTALADGSLQIREVNRALGLELPVDGPKTLNGLVLEHLQDIPEADVSLKIAGVVVEILHAQGRTVKTVRLFRPAAQRAGETA